jgi:polyferredoxin
MNNEQLVSALQAVISPVVLISGVGMLVLSMTNRLSHAQDRLRHLIDDWHEVNENRRQRITAQIRIFERRLRILVVAIALGLGTVLLTSLLIITLFANYLVGTTFRGLIIVFFALSLVSLVGASILFIRDMTLATNALQEELRDIR